MGDLDGYIARLNARRDLTTCVQLVADLQSETALSEWQRKSLLGSAKRKLAGIKRQGSQIGPKIRDQIVKRDRDLCRYCGYSAGRGWSAIDHVVPVIQGGTTDLDNLALACFRCNSTKGGRTPEEAGMTLEKPGTTAWDIRRAARANEMVLR